MNLLKTRLKFICFFVFMSGFSGLAHSHGDAAGEDNHAYADTYLAEQARLNEAQSPYLFIDHWQQQLSDKLHTLSNSILSELVNPAYAGISNPAVDGQWAAPVAWPFAFASAANTPDGKILAWGGNEKFRFTGGTSTHSALLDPATSIVTENDDTTHALFCGMPVMLEDGRVLVSGGDVNSTASVRMTSTYNPVTGTWSRVQDMHVGRWYSGAVVLRTGNVFAAAGEPGSQYPEMWDEATGWTYMNGASLQAAILNFPTVTEPKNWLPHLHLAPNGQVFHSGHTPDMHYIDMEGNGAVLPVSIKNDWNTANIPSVLYNEGKLLQAGGALYATGNPSTTKAALIDLNSPIPSRTLIPDMHFPRIFHNQVTLPNGEVMVIGGNTTGTKFSDKDNNGVSTSILAPEIWNPADQSWRVVAPHTIPRNYHSVALLMTDGRVWSGGGGLCNCTADHPNSEIYSPPYLFNANGTEAVRPQITAIAPASGQVSYGQAITIGASSGISKFSMVRMSSTTHALNSDMRFLTVPFTSPSDGQYRLTLHTNPNVMVPGYWMLFALDAQGVPSKARVIRVVTTNSPEMQNIDAQTSIVNTNVSLGVIATDPNGNSLTYGAAGLPSGLAINTATGQITGKPKTVGSNTVVVSATDGTFIVTTKFVWNVVSDQTPVPSPVFGGIGGTIFADIVAPAQSLASINVRAGGRIDGIQAVLNTGPLANHGGTGGTAVNVTWPSNEYLVRIFGVNGAQVGRVSFATNTGRILGPYGAATSVGSNGATFDYTVPLDTEIVGFTGRSSTYLDSIGVMYRNRLDTNQPPVVTGIVDQNSHVGDLVNLQVSATDPDGDPMAFSAAGLPAGLAIDPVSGVVSGTLTAAGTKNVVITVQDNKGASAALNFKWAVTLAQINFVPVTTTPAAAGTVVTLTASVTNGLNPKFKWSFGDGKPDSPYSLNATVTHSFDNPGLFPLKVTVLDDTGATSSNNLIQAIYLPHTAKSPTASTNILVDGANRLWVVNQDSDTVSAFNATTHAKLAEIAVGKAPRAVAQAPDGRIWVTNRQGASVSIIDPSTLTVVQTVALPFASQPYGLAFAPDDSAAYVVLEGAGKLLKLDPANLAQLAVLNVGPNPRHLSVTADSGKVLVSRFITPPMPGEATASIDTSTKGGEVVVVNAAAMAINKTVTLQHSDLLDDTARGSGIPNYLGVPAISPDGLSAWVPSKQDNIKRGTLRNGNNLNFQNTVRGIASKVNLSTLAEVYGERIDFDNSGVGSAAVFDRTGSYMFVALESTREVEIVDAYAGNRIDRINVGRAPDGLAVSADGKKLFVNNFMDRTVSVVDITGVLSWGDPQPPVVAQFSASNQEKLAANVLAGKQFFYDAQDLRLARDGYLSCAVCHNDGGHDGRVWDLTGMGEGLRNTIALRGRSGAAGHGILHWSGNFDEVQDFEGQIRGLAAGTGLMTDADFAATSDTLGTPKAGKSADLDKLAAYLTSLNSFAESPQRNADGSLTADAVAGKALFTSAGCGQCHTGAPFTDSPAGLPHNNVGTIKPSSGKRLNGPLTAIDTPTLRDVWDTAPYLHDGSAATVDAAIRAHNTVTLTDAEIAKVAAYVRQIGAKEPGPVINTPPVVSITAPTTGSTVTGAAVAITATAADSDGVAGVQFRLDGNNLGAEDTTAPYAITWNSATVANGQHTLAAVARDTAGGIANSAPITVTVNNTAAALPDVVVTSLSYAGGVFTSTIKNQGTVATPTGIVVGVGYYVDGVYKTWGAKTGNLAAGASATVVTNGAKFVIPNGTHTISAYVDDAKRFAEADETNNSLTQTITVGGSDTIAPTVSITAPALNSTVTGVAINITATATDNVAVTGVQFKLDGANLGAEDTTAPYGITWDSTVVANGPHTITAVARDTSNNVTTSTAVPVTVNNTTTDSTPPTVSVSAPLANSTVTGSAVNVTATAADNVAVAGVQFKLDGVNLGVENTTAPYGITWDSTTVANGSHTLTAVARDTSNNATTSTAVTVTVNNTGVSLPDVVVTSVTYANGVFNSVVKNQGTVATPAGVIIGVGYSVDGVYKTWGAKSTGTIAPGASATIGTGGAKYTIPSGTHTISANADDAKRFAESDETNNTLTKSITIP